MVNWNGERPTVSTNTAKKKTRAAGDVAALQSALMDTLNLLDQVQTAGRSPRRLNVNATNPNKKKWNQKGN